VECGACILALETPVPIFHAFDKALFLYPPSAKSPDAENSRLSLYASSKYSKDHVARGAPRANVFGTNVSDVYPRLSSS